MNPLLAALLGFLLGRGSEGEESGGEKMLIALFGLGLAAVIGAGIWGIVEQGGWSSGPFRTAIVVLCLWFIITKWPVGNILFVVFTFPSCGLLVTKYAFGVPAMLSENAAVTLLWLVIGSFYLLIIRAGVQSSR